MSEGALHVKPSVQLPVPVSVEDPVAFLWGAEGQDFILKYIDCQPPPLNTLAKPFAHLFHAPSSVNDYYRHLTKLGLQRGGVVLPDFYEQGASSGFSALAACQRGSHFSREGWPRIVPEGLGVQGHLEAALAIDNHPFHTEVDLPLDLDFAVHCATSEIQIQHRRSQIRRWRAKAKQLSDLSHACLLAMSPRVRAVAARTNIAMWLYLCIATAWADVTLPGRFLVGFSVVGRVEDVPIFRPVERCPKPGCSQNLLDSAEAYTATLMQQLKPSKCPEADAALLALCRKDLDRGGAAGFLTKEAVDAKYGVGRWRALPRFPLHQGEKWRGIDDGRRSGHNDESEAWCRVRATSHDLVLALARRFKVLAQKARRHAALQAGVDDESAAYRWRPTADVHACFLIVGFYHHEVRGVRFLELYGHPFGLSSSVLNYNRGPELQVAAARQLLRVPSLHFYDDNLCMDLADGKGSAQQSFGSMCSLLGVQLDPDKKALMSAKFVYTGVLFDFTPLFEDGTVVVSPKPGRIDSLRREVDSALLQNKLSSAQASSLRGKSAFLSSQIQGRIQRFADTALAQRQYRDKGSTLTMCLRDALHFLQSLLGVLPPRVVAFLPQSRPCIIYTDAMWSQGQPAGLSCVIFSPRRRQPVGLYSQLPEQVFVQFTPRDTHINQAEIAALLLATCYAPDLLKHEFVVHFVDNSAALAGLVKGHSCNWDSSALLSVFAIQTASLRAHFWHEWVESIANVSDGLSRDGEDDEFLKGLSAEVLTVPFPLDGQLADAPLGALLKHFNL